MLKNRWWGLMCLCMTLALHGCPFEVEQEIGNNEDDAGQGQGGVGGNAEGGEGGQGGNAEGGEGGQGGNAEGGQGGNAEGGQGGNAEGGQGGNVPQGCPDGFEEIDSPDQCDEGQECFELDDGRWCRGPLEIGECPDGYELANECRPDADCIALADGLFCVGEPQGDDCPDGFQPVDECPADAECVLTNDGQMCARLGGPQGCPDGFEVTDGCDEDRAADECFQIDDGLFCQWIGEPQGCPQGFVEVQDPDECFDDGQDPNDPNGFGQCIEIDGRLCRQVENPPECPDGFELTDQCDEDGNNPQPGEDCFPLDNGLFCQWIGEPQGCPQGFVEVDECNDQGECVRLDDGRVCQWFGQQGCPEGFEPVDDPDQCWAENGDAPNDPAPPLGECVEVDGVLCRPTGEPQGCPAGFQQVDEMQCIDDNNNNLCECIDGNGDGECDLWCREARNVECPDGFELADWCDEDFAGECFPIDDGLFCRWIGEPQGCPAGFQQVDQMQCIDDNNNNLCECIDSNGDGECDLWCREARNVECPDGFELSDFCDADSPNECFPIDDGLFCRWIGEPQGCPAGFQQVDEMQCIDDNNNNVCECIDSNGDGECDLWCREAPNAECPDGFAEGCNPNQPGECIDLPNGQACQAMN